MFLRKENMCARDNTQKKRKQNFIETILLAFKIVVSAVIVVAFATKPKIKCKFLKAAKGTCSSNINFRLFRSIEISNSLFRRRKFLFSLNLLMNSKRQTAVKPDYIYSNTMPNKFFFLGKMRKTTTSSIFHWTNANVTIAVKLELFCENDSHVRSIY